MSDRYLRVKILAALIVAIVSGGAPWITSGSSQDRAASNFRIDVVVSPSVRAEPVDGRLIVVISRRNDPEPRFQVDFGLRAQPLFGVDVDGLKPGEAAIIDRTTRGWPVESLSQIPPGEYYVQAVLNIYTTFRRADGHIIKAHMDQGEGQQWNRSPGNLVSESTKVRIDSGAGGTLRLDITKVIPPLEPPQDTKYLKHIKFRSEILSRWWGHDMFLGAVVVLPEGFDGHPKARYPVLYHHGHFPRTFAGFRETPPGPELTGNARTQAEARYRLFRDWVSGKLGRFLIVLMQHPTPFYDDSYAVNSQNNGPYGDALTQELIPLVETQFRAIGQPWARTLMGGSTGGWESLAWQIFYPDHFNGVWSFCPDPVDFRYFQLVNIYEDENAFHPNSEWKREPIRPLQRGVDDQVIVSQKDESHFEAVLGTRGRSGGQLDIFMTVFGPVGSDGYPTLLWNKWTGEIDRSLVEYWRENYDLRHILERDWMRLGPKLVGKLHIFMGDMDSYFLEEATFKLKEFLEKTQNPPYAGSFDIGPRQPHCYAGAPMYPGQSAYARVLPKMLERVLETAPPGADVKSWRY